MVRTGGVRRCVIAEAYTESDQVSGLVRDAVGSDSEVAVLAELVMLLMLMLKVKVEGHLLAWTVETEFGRQGLA